MACNAPVYSPRGRAGLGVVQPQSGRDYPFIAPSADISGLVADLYIEYDDAGLYQPNIAESSHSLRVTWLYGVGCVDGPSIPGAPAAVNAADIVIVDENDVVIFDSTSADAGSPKIFSTRAWGTDYVIYEWIGKTALCRLVAYSTWPPDVDVVTEYPINLAPESAVIDDRAVYKTPKRVTSLTALLTNMTNTAVNFKSGFNMLTTVEPVSRKLRRTSRIEFNAVAGAGDGRFSNCTDDDLAIKCINGVCGPSILIEAPDCLWLSAAGSVDTDNGVFVPIPATQTLQSGCDQPCCACPDYVITGEFLNDVADSYQGIGDIAHDVLGVHSENIDIWTDQRICRAQKPIKLASTAQRCPYIDVVVQYCNLCEDCAEDVIITLTGSTYPALAATGEVQPCFTFLSSGATINASYYIPGDWPTFQIRFGNVAAGNRAKLIFRLGIDPAIPVSVRFSAQGTAIRNGVLGPIRRGCNDEDQIAIELHSVLTRCSPTGSTLACV